MRQKLERDQLVLLVERVKQSEGTEDEIGQWLDQVDQSVPAPTGYVSDLIFWPSDHGYTEELSSLEIVDKALSYKPICL